MVVRKGTTTLSINPAFKSFYLAQGFLEEVEKEVMVEKEKKVVEPKKEDGFEKPKYTKTEINRMSIDDLKSLAPTLGVEVTEDSKGAELKAKIIEVLGL